LIAWFENFLEMGNTGRLFIIPTTGWGDYNGATSTIGAFGTNQASERWLALPEMIKLGILDVQTYSSVSGYVTPYLVEPDGFGGVTTTTYGEGLLSTVFSGSYTSPDDLILISFFDESGSAYHYGPFTNPGLDPWGPKDVGPGVSGGDQPFDPYIRDFEHFVGTYSPLTGSTNRRYRDIRKSIIRWNL